MNVTIADFSNSSGLLKGIINKMNAHQKAFSFAYFAAKDFPIDSNKIIGWNEGIYLLNGLVGNSETTEDYKIGIFANPLENNWFSVTNHGERSSIITISGWNLLSDLCIESFLILEITENLCEQLVDFGSDYSFVHEVPIGCINDLCIYKSDIRYKILSGYICPSCRTIIKSQINDEQFAALISLLDLSREFAHGNYEIAPQTDSAELIYPVAVQFRKLNGASNLYTRFSILFDIFDMSIRTATIIFASYILKEKPDYALIIQQNEVTYGIWIRQLRRLVKFLKNKNDKMFEPFIDEIYSFCHGTTINEINYLRNNTRGHGLTANETKSKTYFDELFPRINLVIENLYPILSLKTVTDLDLKRDPERNNYIVQGKILNGDNPVFIRESLSMEIPDSSLPDLLIANNIFVFISKSNKFINISPFLRYDTCPACRNKNILIYNRPTEFTDCNEGHIVKLT